MLLLVSNTAAAVVFCPEYLPAICADAVSMLTRRSYSLSRGKVRELLAVDWTYDHPVRGAMTLEEVFEACLSEDQSKVAI